MIICGYIHAMTFINDDHWVESASADSNVRDQLVAAAGVHFGKFGYEKTTLAELAKAIGFSKTYFYRSFRSKQEIGEAVYTQCIDKILGAIATEVEAAQSASEKLRKALIVGPVMGLKFLREEPLLFEIAVTSSTENWVTSTSYMSALAAQLSVIVAAGRESGEFERKTPLDEVVRAIMFAMRIVIDPRLLRLHVDTVPEQTSEAVRLVLRSLAL